ncbi:MAG: hypothetical protein ABI597_09365 [Gammaproteobacteria bacterium]
MAKRKSLTRICTACGIEKPLSAFLHISGAQGTTYGTICSTCRSAGITEKSNELLTEDERSGTSSGIRIGSKQKVEIEKQKKLEFKEFKEKQVDEVKKREKTSYEKLERTEQTEKAEKDHRKTFIDAKKQGFLNYQTKPPLSSQSVIGQKRDDRPSGMPFIEEKRQVVDAKNVEDVIRQELNNTTVDLSGAPLVEKQSNVESRDNPTFRKFQAWLGSDAPLMKTMSQLYKTPVAQSKTSGAPQQKSEKETPHHAEKPHGPSSRKR